MKVQLIRNATLLLEYNQQRILIDPMLSPKHAFRSFAGISENPTVDLPMSADEVLTNIDAVIVSHLHPDHFDEPAQQALEKSLPLFTQPESEETIIGLGFTAVTAVKNTITWEGIEITPTPGEHGFGEMIARMGPVTGFVFRAEGEPTVYWAGDTVLYAGVEESIAAHQPDIIITHSGGAQFGGPESLILMDTDATLAVAKQAPQATLIAVHMESLDHCPVTRAGLKAAADEAGIGQKLLIPADGERLSFD
ncbi:MAG: MBL fold metallo-hydrolase [Chloroflexota bacterium]